MVVLLTVAVRFTVWGGASVKFGYRVLTVLGLTVTITGADVEPPPPPQATRNPVRAMARHRPTIL